MSKTNGFFSLIAAASIAIAAAGCGDSGDKSADAQDWNTHAKTLVTDGDADPFAGPAPMKVKLYNHVKRSAGKVKFRWTVDGKQFSTEQNPTITLDKPEFYAITAFATDEKGNQDHTALVLRAWPKKQWEKGTTGLGPGGINSMVQDSQLKYYKKFPSTLPTDLTSDFYKNNPYLKPLRRKYEREQRRKEHGGG